jgi:hypothetical protein
MVKIDMDSIKQLGVAERVRLVQDIWETLQPTAEELPLTEEQRTNWRLIGEGDGIHWPDLDEDISTIMLIEGLPSIEHEKAKTG